MADSSISSQQLNQLIKSINTLIEKSGSKFIKESKPNNTRKIDNIRLDKIDKNSNELKKEIKKIINTSSISTNNLKTLNTYSSRLIETTLENTNNLKDLDKILEKIPKNFSKSLKSFYPLLADTVKNMEDVFKVKDLQVEISKLFTEIKDSNGKTDKLKKVIEKSKDLETKFNINLKDLGIDIQRYTITKAMEHDAIENGIKLDRDLQNEIKAVNKSMKNFDKSIQQSNKSLISSTNDSSKESLQTKIMGKLSKTFTIIKGVLSTGQNLKDGLLSAGKFGVAFDPVTAALTGLTLEELPELQGKLKQTSLSIGGMESVNRILKKSMDGTDKEFIIMAGGLGNATKALGAMTDNARKMGDSTLDTSKVVDDEKELFKKLNSVTGITVDNFNELTTELLNDVDVRNQLMRLDRSQRKAYIDNLRLSHISNSVKGLEIEQSKAMIKTLAEFSSQDPKERMKQTAKLRVFGGALGMNKEADTAARLLMKIDRTAPEQEELTKSLAAIQQEGMRQRKELNKDFVLQPLMEGVLSKLIGAGSATGGFTLGKGKQVDENLAEKTRLEGVLGVVGKDSNINNILKEFYITNENVSNILGKFGQVTALAGQGALGFATATSIAATEISDAVLKLNTGFEFNTNGVDNFIKNMTRLPENLMNFFGSNKEENTKIEQYNEQQMQKLLEIYDKRAEETKINEEKAAKQMEINIKNFAEETTKANKEVIDKQNEQLRTMNDRLEKLVNIGTDQFTAIVKNGKKSQTIEESRR